MLRRSLLLFFISCIPTCFAAAPLTAARSVIGTSMGTLPKMLATDSAGNIYVASTAYADLPTTANAFQKNYFANACGLSGGLHAPIPCGDVYVTKLNPSGDVIYATYLGGQWEDRPIALAANAAGELFILGTTHSPDFPVTAGAIQSKGTGPFLARLSADGSALTYSTYLNMTLSDVPLALALDANGNPVIGVGNVGSALVATNGAFRKSPGPSFLLKIDMTGPRVAWATYYDAPMIAIAVGGTGDVYLTGTAVKSITTTPSAYWPAFNSNIYVTRLSADGTHLVYATYLGASAYGYPEALAVDTAGGAYVTGETTSLTFPVTNGAYQTRRPSTYQTAFLTRLQPEGNALSWSTYLGGNGAGIGTGLAITPDGVVVHGRAGVSTNFPVTTNAFQPGNCTGVGNDPAFATGDGFLARFTSAGKLLFSSYIHDTYYSFTNVLGFDEQRNTAHVLGDDAITSIAFGKAPKIDVACAVNEASMLSSVNSPGGLVAPGEMVTIWGSMGGIVGGIVVTPTGKRPLPTQLSGVRVLFDGIAAPLVSTSRSQIEAMVPFNLIGKAPMPGASDGYYTAKLVVEILGVQSDPITVYVAPSAAGIFTRSITSLGIRQIRNADGSVNSQGNPAARGSEIELCATGLGVTDPLSFDGAFPVAPYPVPQAKVLAAVGGYPLSPLTDPSIITYVGGANGLISGVSQVKIRIPDEVTPGVNAVRLWTLDGAPAQNATIWVR